MPSKDNDMTLEERIVAGGLVYFCSVVYDPDQRSLRLEILAGPESETVRDILLFSQVVDFQEVWHDRDEKSLEHLIGLDEVANGRAFVIHTDQREMCFSTEAEPILETVEA